MCNSLEQFPFLTEQTEIHLTPNGGTLFFNGVPHNLGFTSVEFAIHCNGNYKIREILPVNKLDNLQSLELIGFISKAIESGWIELSKKQLPLRSRVTGSRTAFYPPHMIIELTESCNLQCSYCYRESELVKKGHMPVKKLLEILEKLWNKGLRSVELTGGEPLLNEGFEEIIDFCLKNFYLTGILSNGTLLTDQFDDKFIKAKDRLILSISLDASTSEIHDKRRGVLGAFKRTVSNIKRLADLGVKIRVSMVVDDDNFSEIENTLLLAKKLGAATFGYTPVLPFGRAKKGYSSKWQLNAKVVAKKEDELIKKYKGFLNAVSEEQLNEIEGEDGCGAGYRSFAMDPWGNVRPCATFGTKELLFGNLITQNFEEVFSHPAIFAINELRAPSPIFCSGCIHEHFCRYCSLRGLHKSKTELGCDWKKQKSFEALKPYWNPPS